MSSLLQLTAKPSLRGPLDTEQTCSLIPKNVKVPRNITENRWDHQQANSEYFAVGEVDMFYLSLHTICYYLLHLYRLNSDKMSQCSNKFFRYDNRKTKKPDHTK